MCYVVGGDIEECILVLQNIGGVIFLILDWEFWDLVFCYEIVMSCFFDF